MLCDQRIAQVHAHRRILGVCLRVRACVCVRACVHASEQEKSNSEEDLALFLGGLNVSDHVAEKYLLSCYFILTVCTTVGFGDIGASNQVMSII